MRHSSALAVLLDDVRLALREAQTSAVPYVIDVPITIAPLGPCRSCVTV